MRRTSLVLVSALTLLVAPRSDGSDRAKEVFHPGETLRYKVTWTFFRLGTIIVRTERDTASGDPGHFKLVLRVESNPDLQFVSIQELNESFVETAEISTRHFLARHRNGDELLEIRERYDRPTQRATFSKTDLNTGAILDSGTIHRAPPFVEGPALLFKARALSRSQGSVVLPTMVNGRIQNTILDFGSEVEDLGIDAWEEKIRTRKYLGHADWTGGTSSGLGGDFVGWVSDDEAAVPIRAELKILLGSLVLELEEWSRPGWTPPSGLPLAERR